MKKQTGIFLVTVVLIIILTGVAAVKWSDRMGKVNYLEHLNETVFSVDGTDYKLRNLAFYIAFEENDVEKQAEIYDTENTNAYWNAHVNGKFIKLSAKSIVMDMAIHDVILYDLALKDEMELSTEEQEFLEGKQKEFWAELSDKQKERIGVSQEEMNQTLSKMALAQKEQQFLAMSDGAEYEDYNINGDAYQDLLEEHTYTINEKLWKRVDFGNITLQH